MKPASSLFAKILSWFFLNMILVAAFLAVFIVFQPHVSLHAIFDLQGTDRLRTAGLLIAHDLSQTPKAKWPEVLARHAAIYRVDFTIVLEDGSRFSSTDVELPGPVLLQVRDTLRHRPQNAHFQSPTSSAILNGGRNTSLTETHRTIGPSKTSPPCPPDGMTTNRIL